MLSLILTKLIFYQFDRIKVYGNAEKKKSYLSWSSGTNYLIISRGKPEGIF